eukprot:Opistho-2@70085
MDACLKALSKPHDSRVLAQLGGDAVAALLYDATALALGAICSAGGRLESSLLITSSLERSLALASCVADACHEHLYIGHWKDVPIEWRVCYARAAAVAALASAALDRDADAIKWCDLGLLLGARLENALGGADLLSSFATELQRKLHGITGVKRPRAERGDEPSSVEDQTVPADTDAVMRAEHCLSRNEEAAFDAAILRGMSSGHAMSSVRGTFTVDPTRAIPSERLPSMERFLTCAVLPRRPHVITGCIDHWPALTGGRWADPNYLVAVAGHRTVPVELGSKYTDDEWSQQLMTFREFVDVHVRARVEGGIASTRGPVGYLAQHTLFAQVPELRRDIAIPDYCMLTRAGGGDGFGDGCS